MKTEKGFPGRLKEKRGWKRWRRTILAWTLILAFLMPFFAPVSAYGKEMSTEVTDSSLEAGGRMEVWEDREGERKPALDKADLSHSGAEPEKKAGEIQADKSNLAEDTEKPKEGKTAGEITDSAEEGKEEEKESAGDNTESETDPGAYESGEKESSGETTGTGTDPAADETETTEDKPSEETSENGETKAEGENPEKDESSEETAEDSEETEESKDTKEQEKLKEETFPEKAGSEAEKEENEEKQADGLCPHHMVHTEECGYIASTDLECTHGPEENCDCKKEGSPCMYHCPFCITGWKWMDDEELLVWNEETNQWGLGLPGASEEMPVTREILREMLPDEIMADTAAGGV